MTEPRRSTPAGRGADDRVGPGLPHGYCQGRVVLDDAEQVWLEALPDAIVDQIPRRLCCVLHEHDNSVCHAAIGQVTLDTVWWVRWTASAHVIKEMVLCEFAEHGRDPGDQCVLFVGHPGAHDLDGRPACACHGR
jgi:hypothetical protein